MHRVWIVIGVLTGLVVFIFGNRIWNIRFLYVRSDVRADLVQIMHEANDVKGWSASDLDLRTIVCANEKKCLFVFEYHYRGPWVKSETQKIEAWVENNSVRFERL